MDISGRARVVTIVNSCACERPRHMLVRKQHGVIWVRHLSKSNNGFSWLAFVRMLGLLDEYPQELDENLDIAR